MMTSVFVKICGITRQEDAAAAVAYGARALGFVFWPGSPRFVDPYGARAIVAALPPFVTPVGVFVNQDREYIRAVAALVGLGAVQLHGDEDPALARTINRPVIKSLSAATAAPDAAAVTAIWPRNVLMLVDAHDPVRRGGTGTSADWTFAASLAAERPVLLAGGLGPENVAEALTRVRPFGIDVSSGVERSPGIKDDARLAALFAALGHAASASAGSRR
jgi:phosphoribosylanthranilate isomerase